MNERIEHTPEEEMETKPTPKNRRGRRSYVALAAGAGLFLTGCAKNAPQDIFQPKGPNANDINNLQKLVFPIAGVVGVIVLGLATYIFLKFKDRGQPIPTQAHGKPIVEITNMSIRLTGLTREQLRATWAGRAAAAPVPPLLALTVPKTTPSGLAIVAPTAISVLRASAMLSRTAPTFDAAPKKNAPKSR